MQKLSTFLRNIAKVALYSVPSTMATATIAFIASYDLSQSNMYVMIAANAINALAYAVKKEFETKSQ